jgi:hypothetical protein
MRITYRRMFSRAVLQLIYTRNVVALGMRLTYTSGFSSAPLYVIDSGPVVLRDSDLHIELCSVGLFCN